MRKRVLSKRTIDRLNRLRKESKRVAKGYKGKVAISIRFTSETAHECKESLCQMRGEQ